MEIDLDKLGELAALQGVVKFPVRIKCATLSWNALAQGLDEVAAEASWSRRAGLASPSPGVARRGCRAPGRTTAAARSSAWWWRSSRWSWGCPGRRRPARLVVGVMVGGGLG